MGGVEGERAAESEERQREGGMGREDSKEGEGMREWRKRDMGRKEERG